MLDSRVLILGKDKPYMGHEDKLQELVATQLVYQYQDYIWYHPPNGGRRNGREAAKFKRMGVVGGVSDLIFDEPVNGFHGLRIELKTKKNKPTPNQERFLNRSVKKGYFCAVCWNESAVFKLIRNYLDGLYTKEESKAEG